MQAAAAAKGAAASAAGAASRLADSGRVQAAMRTFNSSSPTTKALCSLLVGSYFLIKLPGMAELLALVPDKTVPRVWNVFTAGFCETNFLVMLVNVASLLYLGRRIEPVWGARELLHFAAVVNLSVGVTAWFLMYLLYLATRDQYYLFARFGGFQGVTAALLVALRQTSPDEPFVPELLPPLAALGLRHRHLSGAFVAGTAVLALFSGALHHHIGLYSFVLSGSYFGWLYLRFFQPVSVACGARGDAAAGGAASASALRGDPREEFSFASLFPAPLEPVISRLSAPLYACCCTPAARPAGAPAPASARAAAASSPPRQRSPPRNAEAASTPGGGAAGDAARQRELAARGMRLLEARMSSAGPTPPRQNRASVAAAAAAAAAAASTPQPAAEEPADEAV